MAAQDIKSVIKAFAVLDMLFLNFGVGFTQTEIREATGLSSTLVYRYLNTLIAVGYAEEIKDTKRYRPSHKVAQKFGQVVQSLNELERSAQESINRITRS